MKYIEAIEDAINRCWESHGDDCYYLEDNQEHVDKSLALFHEFVDNIKNLQTQVEKHKDYSGYFITKLILEMEFKDD